MRLSSRTPAVALKRYRQENIDPGGQVLPTNRPPTLLEPRGFCFLAPQIRLNESVDARRSTALQQARILSNYLYLCR
jgi:hypothetical protein